MTDSPEIGRPGMMGDDLRTLAAYITELAATLPTPRPLMARAALSNPQMAPIEQLVVAVAALVGTVTDLSAASAADRKAIREAFAVGAVSTPAIALNVNTDVTVTLDRAMPTAQYTPHLLGSAALLTNTTMTVKSQTRSTVTVTLRAPIAISAGQTLTVIATP